MAFSVFGLGPMDAHSLKLLEFPKVLDLLARHCACALGRDAAMALEPSPHAEVVERRLQQTREARHLLELERGIPLGGIQDIRPHVQRAEREQMLSPGELLDVGLTAASARRLKTELQRKRDACPLLAEYADELPPLQHLDTRIADCIAENAEVRDTASPELASIRGKKKLTHTRLMERLNSLLGSSQYKTAIQDPVITLRDGRYCIPVKAEYRGAFGGILHDASASGATVFIEPGSCVELGNQLRELTVQEEQEVARILRKLTEMVAGAAAELRTLLRILAEIDLASASAHLAVELNACEPQRNTVGRVRLLKARHPLLTGEVVPIDVEVGGDYSVLLITGPNTGGKTVTLKTVGLLAAMLQAGLQIPCSPDSEMSLFSGIYADIGDEQDIQQSLSTFSSHLRNIVHILDSLEGCSLVLLDEIGAGTDPTEGAALAKAILEELQQRGARVIATTHYGELKEFAYSHPGIQNAAVEFDRDTLRPTYRVLHGVPGSSHAFYIAGRLGLSHSIVETARAHLATRDRDTTALMQQIEQSRRRALALEAEAAAAREAAEQARQEYEQRARQLKDLQRTAREQVLEEARLVLRRASDQAETILADLKRMNRGGRKGPAARRQLAAIRRDTVEALAPPEPERQEQALPEGYVLRAGDEVRVLSLNARGRLLADPQEGVASVQIGPMRAVLPVDDLAPAGSAEATEKRSARSEAAAIGLRKAANISPELTLRALRVEEAAPLLDKYLDDAYAAGMRQTRIVHGKGTGALRRYVHETLRHHPLVQDFRLADDNEGGDGATLVTLKD